MALEYESICMFADHRLAAGASEGDVRNLLNSIFAMIVPVEVHYQWRTPLPDASGTGRLRLRFFPVTVARCLVPATKS